MFSVMLFRIGLPSFAGASRPGCLWHVRSVAARIARNNSQYFVMLLSIIDLSLSLSLALSLSVCLLACTPFEVQGRTPTPLRSLSVSFLSLGLWTRGAPLASLSLSLSVLGIGVGQDPRASSRPASVLQVLGCDERT